MEKERKKLALKASSVQPPTEDEPEERVNGNAPSIRTASKEQFEQAQRKTSKLHAGLFRRLAK